VAIKDAVVLVVDDVADNRDILIRRLRRLGIEQIEQAENGLEALDAIARRGFHLMLLDIMMPELDGFGVLEELKRQGRSDLPVVVISALNEIEPVVRCLELGAEDFVFKPFNPVLLKARVTATIEKKQLRDQTRAELERKRMELNEARDLQLALVPAPFCGELRDVPLRVDVLLEPAREVGGDLVDWFVVGEGRVVLVLGDVSDKGAGSALVMARTHALLRGLSTRPDADALFARPEQAATLVNESLSARNASNMFVTFFLGSFDPAEGELAYVCAGHVPPFLRAADGTVERLTARCGLPLGAMEGAPYRSERVPLARGTRLLVVTDGITEAVDRADVQFGEERVARFLAALDDAAADPLGNLADLVRAHEGEQPAYDDVAAILLTLPS
jgi:sigma-B regulation protein RsbU (phosphoserine phosphatase)